MTIFRVKEMTIVFSNIITEEVDIRLEDLWFAEEGQGWRLIFKNFL